MKKLFFVLLLAVGLGSCAKDEVNTFKIDPLATVSIKPASGVKMRSSEIDTVHLSALEIVKQTSWMEYTVSTGSIGRRGFAPLQRDTISETPMLKMWGTDILYYEQLIDGAYTTNLILAPDFLEAKNCLLMDRDGKILAYIPNSVLRSAETQIKSLFAAGEYESIYKIFNDAYTFIPITETEYEALKAQNLQ